MPNLYYNKDHEWIRSDGEMATVGITNYAQSQLGDVVFVELPDVGRKVVKGAEVAVVESVKAASEIYAPASGEVVAVNEALEAAPATVNDDAEGEGWFFKLRLASPDEVAALMTEAQYKSFLETIA